VQYFAHCARKVGLAYPTITAAKVIRFANPFAQPRARAAAKRRKNAAHGASRGSANQQGTSPVGAAQIGKGTHRPPVRSRARLPSRAVQSHMNKEPGFSPRGPARATPHRTQPKPHSGRAALGVRRQREAGLSQPTEVLTAILILQSVVRRPISFEQTLGADKWVK